MANLVPPKAKKIVVKEYWMRVLAVWMFFITAACVIVTVLMIPTYILVGAQQEALVNRSNKVPIKQSEFKEMSEQVADTNKLAQYLEQQNKSISISELITEIDALAGENVTVLEYNFKQEMDSVTPLTIGGVAADRTALANFRDVLSVHELFSEVTLPLSNLAGDMNIPFSMQLILNDN